MFFINVDSKNAFLSARDVCERNSNQFSNELINKLKQTVNLLISNHMALWNLSGDQPMCKIERLAFQSSPATIPATVSVVITLGLVEFSFICTVFFPLCFGVFVRFSNHFFWEMLMFILVSFSAVKTTIVLHIPTPSGEILFRLQHTTNCSSRFLGFSGWLCVVIHSFTKINTFMTF